MVKVQREASKNLGGNKIMVWENGGGDGKNTTANFVSGRYKAVPPMKDMFDMAVWDCRSIWAKEFKH